MATDNDMMIIVMIIIMTIIIITMIIMALASLLAADAHEDSYRCIYASKGTVKLAEQPSQKVRRSRRRRTGESQAPPPK